MFPMVSSIRGWTSVFLCAAVALFLGLAQNPAQAHCKGKHTDDHEHCDSVDNGRSDNTPATMGLDPRTKHLFKEDPELYNWGDIIHTIEMWKAHLKEFAKDPTSYELYEENLRLIPVIRRSMDDGLRVNVEKVQRSIPLYRDRMQNAQRLAQVYAGWPINVGSPLQCKRMLYDVLGLPVQKKKGKITTDKDAIGELRKQYLGEITDDQPTVEMMMENIEAGGHPFLEGLHLYNKAEHVLGAYLMPLVSDE